MESTSVDKKTNLEKQHQLRLDEIKKIYELDYELKEEESDSMFKEEINAHLGTMMTRQITEFRTENFTIGSSNYSPAYLSLSAAGAGKEGLDFLNNWKKVALYISLLKF